MCYTIALNFEDGITRFVDCRKGEKVLDAAFRNKINLPMDCSDGVCGTCKCRAESGSYDMGEDYIEDALTEDEAAEGLVLTCQMVPSSDCVISVPVTAASCKTGQQVFAATVTRIEPQQDAAVVLKLDAEDAPAFLPGQYVNIAVPGSSGHRSYSFSTAPGERSLGFLIKKIEGGLMSGWLTRAASPSGDPAVIFQDRNSRWAAPTTFNTVQRCSTATNACTSPAPTSNAMRMNPSATPWATPQGVSPEVSCHPARAHRAAWQASRPALPCPLRPRPARQG